MLNSRIIPCLLLKGLGLVKTVNFDKPKYIGDPINAIKIFNEKEVDELIFLDITATKEKRKPNFEIISKIAGECFMPFAYGGGIRDIGDITKTLEIGVEKVIINTFAFENPRFIKEASEKFGSQSIVAAIDIKNGGGCRVFINGEKTKLNPAEHAKNMASLGAGELFINFVDRDGKMEGYDLEMIEKISQSVSIPVIACGGAGNISDLNAGIMAGASAVSAGSMFVFYGKNKSVLISYPAKDEIIF